IICLIIKMRLPTITTLFPYTTLFRSEPHQVPVVVRRRVRVAEVADVAVRPHVPVREQDVLGRDHPRRARRAHALDDRGAEADVRSEEHTSELQSQSNLVCRLLLEKKK